MNLYAKMDEIEAKVRNEAEVITVLPLDGHRTYHTKICDYIEVDGLHMEFGVYRGTSITTFSNNIDGKMIYGFDSFEGLPDKWDDANPKGAFNLNGMIPAGPLDKSKQIDPGMLNPAPHVFMDEWNPNIRLIKGMVQDTVGPFLEEHEGPIAFMHMDLDIYSSTRSVFLDTQHRIVDGTVIAFDELLDYPTYKEHEMKAFAELLLENDLDFEPLLYQVNGYDYTQVTVRIKK